MARPSHDPPAVLEGPDALASDALAERVESFEGIAPGMIGVETIELIAASDETRR